MKVLLAPLDWGLGHATRSLTLAKAFEALGHEICLASNGGALQVLRQALPGRAWWELPGYDVSYTESRGGFLFSLLQQLPKIRIAIRKEHTWIQMHGQLFGFDLIVSDGRYGLWHSKIPSVLVTHQIALHPPMHWPWPELGLRLSEKLNRSFLKRFKQVWIPDLETFPGLAARLSHPRKSLPQVRYLGPLNRFAWDATDSPPEMSESTEKPPIQQSYADLEWLGIVSGPEPQRQALEDKLKAQLEAMPGTRILVLGKPNAVKVPQSRVGDDTLPSGFQIRAGELNIFNHVPGPILLSWLRAAKAIVTRSGYTTVMEMACLDIRPILMVPTPGQPEQEYLARELAAKDWVYCQSQAELNLAAALPKLRQAKGLGSLLKAGDAPGATREGLIAFLKREIPFLT